MLVYRALAEAQRCGGDCQAPKSPTRGPFWDCLWKTFTSVFASIPGPLLVESNGSVRVRVWTREKLFAATASGSSSATSCCLMDAAFGFHHRQVMSGLVRLCPALRADGRWISNWHAEHKSPRTRQSEILNAPRPRSPSGQKGLVRHSLSPV